MPALLPGEALLQLLHDLVPAAQRFDLRLLFFGEETLGKHTQPFLRDIGRNPFDRAVEALEDIAKNTVELVEMALVLHERGAGKIIEIVDALSGYPNIHRVQEGEIFLHAHRDAGIFQLVEKVEEHGTLLSPRPERQPRAFGFGLFGLGGRLRRAALLRCFQARKPIEKRAAPFALFCVRCGFIGTRQGLLARFCRRSRLCGGSSSASVAAPVTRSRSRISRSLAAHPGLQLFACARRLGLPDHNCRRNRPRPAAAEPATALRARFPPRRRLDRHGAGQAAYVPAG